MTGWRKAALTEHSAAQRARGVLSLPRRRGSGAVTGAQQMMAPVCDRVAVQRRRRRDNGTEARSMGQAGMRGRPEAIDPSMRHLRQLSVSCGAGEDSRGGIVSWARVWVAPGNPSRVWLASGSASLRVLGGTKDPSSERMGKINSGLKRSRVRWVTRLLPSRHVVQIVWQHGGD